MHNKWWSTSERITNSHCSSNLLEPSWTQRHHSPSIFINPRILSFPELLVTPVLSLPLCNLSPNNLANLWQVVFSKDQYIPFHMLIFNVTLTLLHLVFYFCLTNYCKCRSLKQYPCISSQLCRCDWVPSEVYHKAEIKVSTSLSSHLETLVRNLLPNSFLFLEKFSSLYLEG